MRINLTELEWWLVAITSMVLFYTFADFSDVPIKQEVVIDEMAYEEFPLIAWFGTEEKWDKSIGNVVKIKYRVFNHNSRIWVYDENGYVVHKQPFDRDPNDDGSSRDFTYSWRLYESEWSEKIVPGDYTIRMGYGTSGTGGTRGIILTIE